MDQPTRAPRNRTESPVRVLVLWADPTRSSNLGVRVLAAGTAALIERSLGASAVDYQNFGLGDTGLDFTRKNLASSLAGMRSRFEAEIRKYDLVIDTGAGDSFTDIYGWARLIQMIGFQRLIAKSGVPLIFGPQTIGPFRSGAANLLASKALANPDLVIARDSNSRTIARQLGRSDVTLSSDVVFALPSPKKDKNLDIVLNVSGLLWHSAGTHVSSSHYRRGICAIIDKLLAEGRTITLVPHVLEATSEAIDNDMVPLRQLMRLYKGQPVDAYVPSSLQDARNAFGSARLVIGARMHACLNAISVGTPAIPLAYSDKFRPLLSDLGWPVTIDLRTSDSFEDEVFQLATDETAINALGSTVSGVRALAEERLEKAAVEITAVVR